MVEVRSWIFFTYNLKMSKFRNEIITLFRRKMLQNTKFVLMYRPQGAVPSLPTPAPFL